MKFTRITVYTTVFVFFLSVAGGFLYVQSSVEYDERESYRKMLSVQPLIDVVRWRAGLSPFIEDNLADTRCGIVFVSWDGVPRAEGYELYRDGLLAFRGVETSYIDQDLVLGRSYRYTVRALNSGGESELSSSSVLRALTPCPPQSAPSEVSAKPGVCGGEVVLSWSEVDDADTYRVVRGEEGTGRRSMIPHLTGRAHVGGTRSQAIYEGPGTEFTDSQVSPNTEQTYTIRAVNQTGVSDSATRISVRASQECSPDAPLAPRQ